LQVLDREKIMKTFQDVTARLEQALAGISFDELNISDEVREQVDYYIPEFLFTLMLSIVLPFLCFFLVLYTIISAMLCRLNWCILSSKELRNDRIYLMMIFLMT